MHTDQLILHQLDPTFRYIMYDHIHVQTCIIDAPTHEGLQDYFYNYQLIFTVVKFVPVNVTLFFSHLFRGYKSFVIRAYADDYNKNIF